MASDIGIVAIGRNEGERLKGCLRALKAQISEQTPIVYVDSGSTDDSVRTARELGASVIELDLAQPFTAARARNAGFNYLMTHFPQLHYVQFIDGDCELSAGWLEAARQRLDQDPQLAIVCGYRQERFPQATPYNRYTDLEWQKLPGEASACGGDALVRVKAIRVVNGYNGSLICGEEPEMCIRLRRLGWKIWQLDRVMVIHDADMQHFGQWWKRAVRGGWAVAEGFAMYGQAPEQYMVRRHRSGWFWGFGIPAIALAAAWPTRGLSLLLLVLAYAGLMYRVYRYRRSAYSNPPAHALNYAFFCTLSKFAQAVGQLKYWLTRWQRKTPLLIEYKASN
ncbi:MAG: glycosyltransferase [Leptolyngbya sp. SIO4C1]|nr:glycosyltransferase [Leptolyngbya sp. SIO4C1]